mmetsp:Transcript_231/g.572  ORF Transcript_231/g.572 Transcript_231/m.572 type:complete len:145 (+) Transcript_231:632-1066(+)
MQHHPLEAVDYTLRSNHLCYLNASGNFRFVRHQSLYKYHHHHHHHRLRAVSQAGAAARTALWPATLARVAKDRRWQRSGNNNSSHQLALEHKLLQNCTPVSAVAIHVDPGSTRARAPTPSSAEPPPSRPPAAHSSGHHDLCAWP